MFPPVFICHPYTNTVTKSILHIITTESTQIFFTETKTHQTLVRAAIYFFFFLKRSKKGEKNNIRRNGRWGAGRSVNFGRWAETCSIWIINQYSVTHRYLRQHCCTCCNYGWRVFKRQLQDLTHLHWVIKTIHRGRTCYIIDLAWTRLPPPPTNVSPLSPFRRLSSLLISFISSHFIYLLFSLAFFLETSQRKSHKLFTY